MEIAEIRQLITTYGASINTLVAKVQQKRFELSKEEAYLCIEAYSEILKAYKNLTAEQKAKVDRKIRELSDVHGALDTYSDKSAAIYAHDGLTAFNELLNS